VKPVMHHPHQHPQVQTQKSSQVRTPPRTEHRHSQSKAKPSPPGKKDANDFRHFLASEDESEPVCESSGGLLFCFREPPPIDLGEPPTQERTFHALTPDLIEEIEGHESLPAEFELLLPETGAVSARMTAGDEGVTHVALGFRQDILEKLVGYEKQGERVLSRRLGKPVRLHFKRVEAL